MNNLAICYLCGSKSSRSSNIKRHIQTVHNPNRTRSKSISNKKAKTDIYSVINQSGNFTPNMAGKNGLNHVEVDINTFPRELMREKNHLLKIYRYEPFLTNRYGHELTKQLVQDSLEAYEEHLKKREKESYPLLILRINQRLSFLAKGIVKDRCIMGYYLMKLKHICLLERSTDILDNI